MSIVCQLSCIFFEPTKATAQILFVLGVLHFWKTTWTRLVWRTWPCGTEEYAASRLFNLWPLLYQFEWGTINSCHIFWGLQQLFKELFTCRGGPIDKDVEQLSTEAPVNSSTTRLPVLTETVPHSLMPRIWDVFTPKLRLGPLGLEELSGCQLACLYLSDKMIAGQVVESVYLSADPLVLTGWIFRSVWFYSLFKYASLCCRSPSWSERGGNI